LPFEVRDRADAGRALAYQMTEHVRAPNNWRLFGDLNGVWFAKDREDGDPNPNSGGEQAWPPASID
jgi:hypothetical protein